MQGSLAFKSETTFESVPVRLGKARRLELAGTLSAADDLEELPLLFVPASGESRAATRRPVRLFLVRSTGLAAEGLYAGDQILVEDTQVHHPDALLLAHVSGRYLLRRRERLFEDARLRPRVLGVFIGIVRTRGFARSVSTNASPTPDRIRSTDAKLRILRGQLGMLETTCASTDNPRLRKALRNEAERVRKQLQNGTGGNKRS